MNVNKKIFIVKTYIGNTFNFDLAVLKVVNARRERRRGREGELFFYTHMTSQKAYNSISVYT